MSNEYNETSEFHIDQVRKVRSKRRSSDVQGRYLKDSRRRSRKHHHNSRRRQKIRLWVTVAAVLLVLLAILLAIQIFSKPSLNGRWDMDGATVYEFRKDGHGSLILMSAEYEFAYDVRGDILYIDFIDEGALDAKYTFKVEKKVLFLTGGPGDAKSEYVLERMF